MRARRYVPQVVNGNDAPIGPIEAHRFATYLNGMHNRLHSQFSDGFLASLSRLPHANPLNDRSLVTLLEIVVRSDGTIDRMGVVKSSGNAEFDVAALASMDRAQPFGQVPLPLLSSDGKMYVHWKLHRNEIYACSTVGALPFILDRPLQPPTP